LDRIKSPDTVEMSTVIITRTFDQDYDFGKLNEIKSLDTLNSYFKTSFTHNLDQYAPFDFETDRYALEQKSRNCKVGDYYDTMLQYKKIENCSLPAYENREKWFIFRFEDGLYGIKYDVATFLTYPTRYVKVQNRVNIIEKEERRMFIPVVDLTYLGEGMDPRCPRYLFKN